MSDAAVDRRFGLGERVDQGDRRPVRARDHRARHLPPGTQLVDGPRTAIGLVHVPGNEDRVRVRESVRQNSLSVGGVPAPVVRVGRVATDEGDAGVSVTGEMVDAVAAREFGLVNRVVPVAEYLDAAIQLAAEIAARAPVAAQLAKDAVNMALETSLSAGLAYERNLFYALFSTDDQKEGMAAFLEKRKPAWRGS